MEEQKQNDDELTLEDLAAMVKGGFDSMADQMKKGFEKNERDHEDMKLRLDNTAHRFEVVELEGRVDVVEKKVGIERKR